MIKFRRVKAIIKKQIKDTLKNKTILIQFILFPLISILFTGLIAKNESDIPSNYFVIIFATMFIGMIPTMTTANIITEEKDNNTLRVLMMSNVKPSEYLLGIGFFVFSVCTIGIIIFGVIGKFEDGNLIRFILTMCIGIIASIILGATIGILSKNQMSSSSIVLPVGVILGFLPMMEMFNDSINVFSKYIYTQQINYLINDLSKSNFTFERLTIIGANILVFIIIFGYSYRKGNVAI